MGEREQATREASAVERINANTTPHQQYDRGYNECQWRTTKKKEKKIEKEIRITTTIMSNEAKYVNCHSI